ncbi:MAG: adenosine kinase [Prevotellaceae bacterium]|jgi:sugar/nucleoside kinase (ribokinase family)|nr:adenosine kinase [Prevotellaceae bacterium]
MKNILGIGNALVDILATLTGDAILQEFNLPKGSMQHVDEATANRLWERLHTLGGVQQVAGGSAANTMAGAAQLGLRCTFIGKTGNDEPGRFFADDQAAHGVTSVLLHSATATGRCTVFISPDAERTMATYLGAAIELSPGELDEKMFKGHHYFYIEGYLVQNHDLVRRAMELAKAQRLIIALDLASYNVVEENRDFLHDMLRQYVDIVFANEAEAEAFTGKKPHEAIGELSRLCDIAVVKTGGEGSLVQCGHAVHTVKPYPTNVIDTTGAGDLYAAGFLYGHAAGLPLDRCGAAGSLTASKVVEVIGPKISGSGWAAIKQHLKDYII